VAKVLRIGAYPHRVDDGVEYERRRFESAGHAYRFIDSAAPPEHAEALAAADAIVAGGGRWDAGTFRLAESCRLFLICAVGLDTVDVEAATAEGIAVCHMPDICTHEVAEHTFALLLALVRRVPRLDAQVRGGTWSRDLLEPMARLHGKTLGLLGLGRIALEVASRGRAFGMHVIAHDPYVETVPGIELVGLEELCGRADVLSCHVPLTAATRGLIGEDQLALMKPSACIVNTSRGGIVDEVALAAALRAGALRGAALDVLAAEPPPPGHPLLGLDSVVLTPHAGGFSDEVVDDIPRRAVDEVLAVLASRPPTRRAWVNAERPPEQGWRGIAA
jgi:D-3-phosphoglycerate dehydrogenase